MRRDFIEDWCCLKAVPEYWKRWNIGKLDVMDAYSNSTFSNITSSVKCPARIRWISILDGSIIVNIDVEV